MSVTSLLPRAVLPPIWRELGAVGRATVRCAAPEAPPRGRAALLIPGFMSGDRALRPLAEFLVAAGHAPHPAGISWNVGCSEAAVTRLVARTERLVDRRGERIALVGHSRGGLFARVVAQRRPDIVASVISLGSPHRDQLAVHPLLWASFATLATVGSLRVPGLLRWSCGRSACCAQFDRDLAAPLPLGVDGLNVYTRGDGVVDWRACLDPRTRELEVSSSHCGMVTHPPTLWAVAAVIAADSPSRVSAEPRIPSTES